MISVFHSLCSCERSKLLRARLSRQHNHVDVIDGRAIHISGCCMYVVNASSDTWDKKWVCSVVFDDVMQKRAAPFGMKGLSPFTLGIHEWLAENNGRTWRGEAAGSLRCGPVTMHLKSILAWCFYLALDMFKDFFTAIASCGIQQEYNVCFLNWINASYIFDASRHNLGCV